MSNLQSASRLTTPSIKGSTSVKEVLERIHVRDPNHKPTGIYGRRITDYESQRPVLHSIMAMSLAVLLVGGSSLMMTTKFVQVWNFPRRAMPAIVPSAVPEQLRIPPAVHHQPGLSESTRLTRAPRNQPVPQNLRALFIGPRLVEFRWTPLGDDYEYRVYLANDLSMNNARTVTEQPSPAWSMVWSADDTDANSVWAVVKGINKEGQETAFSRPVNVQLP